VAGRASYDLLTWAIGNLFGTLAVSLVQCGVSAPLQSSDVGGVGRDTRAHEREE
jgi:hypothetical protein